MECNSQSADVWEHAVDWKGLFHGDCEFVCVGDVVRVKRAASQGLSKSLAQLGDASVGCVFHVD